MSHPRMARLSVALCAVLATGSAAAQSAESLFRDAVSAFQGGDLAGAAEQLKAVLAENPGHDEAFRLWQSVESQVVTEMLVARGEVGTLAERFLGLARLGRLERATSPGDAAEVVDRLLSGDEVERAQALLTLRAEFGGWAVPALIGPLGDRSSTENRVLAMQALVQLADQAVLPLVAALDTDDVTTRRNAAAVLGTIGDTRAASALAWMAASDDEPVARATAGEALSRMGRMNPDAVAITRELVGRYLAGDAELLPPYATAAVHWSWSDGALTGEPVLGGLLGLRIAESLARGAIARGAGDELRPLLAAALAAQKAETLAAADVEGVDADLLSAAQARLGALELDLAAAGRARGRALLACLSGSRPQLGAARVLLDVMGSSADERAALAAALDAGDPTIALGAALALARLGVTDARVIAPLTAALGSVPDRIAMSVGDTGLAGDGPGWRLVSSATVAEGLQRAKALPPKDVIVIQDGLQGVTLDTLVFGFKNDPRTAQTPLVIVTGDVDGVSSLYGEQAAAIVERASWAEVASAAGERSGPQEQAVERARRAAAALAALPAEASQGAASQVLAALDTSDDEGVRAAVVRLAAHGRMVDALPAIEAFVLDDAVGGELKGAALAAAARLWGLNGGPRGDGEALASALQALVDSGDDELRLPAAEALGQLR